MPKSKKPLSPEESQIMYIGRGNSENYEMNISFSEKLPEALDMSPEEIVEEVRGIVETRMALDEEIERLNSSKRTSVGYSRAYAANWDAVFGKKNKLQTLN